ncbi:hypothetical protein DSECCO2_446070 [anaerobic digester metagenome]
MVHHFRFPGCLLLEDVGLAIGLVGLDQNRVAARLFQFGELRVQVHGLDERQVEKGMAAVAASLPALHLGGEVSGNLLENSVNLSHKGFILAEEN